VFDPDKIGQVVPDDRKWDGGGIIPDGPGIVIIIKAIPVQDIFAVGFWDIDIEYF